MYKDKKKISSKNILIPVLLLLKVTLIITSRMTDFSQTPFKYTYTPLLTNIKTAIFYFLSRKLNSKNTIISIFKTVFS